VPIDGLKNWSERDSEDSNSAVTIIKTAVVCTLDWSQY
jgi:hypothetical protein